MGITISTNLHVKKRTVRGRTFTLFSQQFQSSLKTLDASLRSISMELSPPF